MVEHSKVAMSGVLSMTWTILAVVVCALLLGEGPALAKPTPGEICAAAKQAATGLKVTRKLTCYSMYKKSGGAFDLATCLQKAETKFDTAFHNAEFTVKGIPKGCTTSGDAAAIESLVDDFVAAVVTALPAAATPTPTPTSAPTATATSSISLKSDGVPCASGAECLNSHCLPDNSNNLTTVCCHIGCADSGAASCGNDGNCTHDGSGCALYSSSTICGSPSCSGAIFTAAVTCNGAGSCGPSTPRACANNLACATATSCATSCTPGTTVGCAANSTCNAGGTACLSNSGQSCSIGSQCLSGLCTGNTCQ